MKSHVIPNRIVQSVTPSSGLADTLIRHRRWLILALHLCIIPFGYLLAFILRFDLPIPDHYLTLFWTTLPFLVVLRLAAFALYGLNQGWLRHAGIADLVHLLKAVSLSSALFLVLLFMTEEARELPRSIVVLDWAIAILLFGAARFGVRAFREGHLTSWRKLPGKRTLIIGAGNAGASFLHSVHSGLIPNINPVGLVDDDPGKRNMRIHGVSVVGATTELKSLVVRQQIQLLVIAIPSGSSKQLQPIVRACMDTGIEFKIVPSLQELLNGRARLTQLRDVQIEDILGRSVVNLDLATVRRELAGEVVLITGGAGSIGAELARQIAGFHPRKLILFEQAESPLYFTQLEIGETHPEVEVVPVVGSITDMARLEQVFGAFRPGYVFHAAAYKHVPMMEANALEAARNNVVGTANVAQCAARHGVGRFVLISTDKAVRPSSIMGATKRIAERLVLGWRALHSSRTDFRVVRFGNVLGSHGSVVPLFKRQLASGRPLTVTHPEMTRYCMTIPEAVQLVLQAAVLPEAAGRISLLEMGEPVRIVDLAENLIRLSGLEPYRDVPVVFTGIRPGEKLHEELMSEVEATVPTAIDEIRVVETDETDGGMIEQGLDCLMSALARGDESDLVGAICSLVPECTSPLRDLGVALRVEMSPPDAA
ncbi:nucleoside-diphosphate sugar epimerase/dehydratase [soil metagenome]